ncbi:MAG: MoxR family ATPase [Oscillospiraceae bacterium]
MKDYLEAIGINKSLIEETVKFRSNYFCDNSRAYKPQIAFYGKDILEMAMAAILQGANLLLCGPKATGKNVLAENLAYIFGRPVYNVSFHVNTDSSSLIGSDTFSDNRVTFRKGSISLCAEYGGFGILDEVNMVKNEAVAVLHSALDYRRIIDIPGYDLIKLHEATRFIGTMNYGYAGTRELNEALVSRFLVLEMPSPDDVTIMKIINDSYPTIKKKACEQFTGLFMDLAEKNENGELSTKSIDLRGLLSAIGVIRLGIAPRAALDMGLANKSFDGFEKDIIEDVMTTRIPQAWKVYDVFEE